MNAVSIRQFDLLELVWRSNTILDQPYELVFQVDGRFNHNGERVVVRHSRKEVCLIDFRDSAGLSQLCGLSDSDEFVPGGAELDHMRYISQHRAFFTQTVQ